MAARREQFVNNAQSDLSVALTNVATTATVADGSIFPVDGDFRIIIDDELILVTARATNVLTIVRGAEGTSAVAHSIGKAVIALLTKGALENYAEENTWHGNASPALRIYNLANGSRGVVSDFTWVNQGGATATDRGNRIVLQGPPDVGTQVRGLFMSAPTAPYSVTIAARGIGAREDFGEWGLTLRENASGKLMSLARIFKEKLEIRKYTSATAFSALLGSSLDWAWGPGVTWFKIEDNNTDLKFYTGPNGLDWTQINTEGRGVFFTTAPDEIGFHVNPNTANNYNQLLEVYHFGEV